MSSANATSFLKKSRLKSQISGTRPSLHNSQLLVSTGIPSLDHVLGGGLAIGTVFLMEEDLHASYSRMVMKYFISEGIMCDHGLLLASADPSCQRLLKELPGAVTDDPGCPSERAADQAATQGPDNMAIAWRYQNNPQVQLGTSVGRFGHYYDLTKTMDRQLIERTQKTLLDVDPSTDGRSNSICPNYEKVLTAIKAEIEAGEYGTNVTSQHRNILRIGINSLGSPLWGEDVMDIEQHLRSTLDPSLPRFLYALRSLLRKSYAVCLLTVPTHLFKEPTLVHRLRHLSDTAVCLEAFSGTTNEQNPAYKEYHGLLHLLKLPRLNSLASHMPDTMDLAFKLRRKKFTIERLHLPPELSDSACRDQEGRDWPATRGGSCAAGGAASSLDF